MGRSVSAKIAAKTQLEMNEFFKSIPWRTTMERLKKSRPLVLVFVKGTKVSEFLVMEPNEILRQGRTQDERQEALKEGVLTELATENAQQAIGIVKSELESEPAPEIKPETTTPETPEAIEPPQTNGVNHEGEVAVGRWVEFESEDKSVKQGCVSFISADEKDFLLTLRDGKSVLVSADKLLSLVPEA